MTNRVDGERFRTEFGKQDLEELFEVFDRDGYVVFENLLTSAEVQKHRDALQPFLDADVKGRNDFEGLKTNRIYAMLAKDPVFTELVTHPLQDVFCRRDLGDSYLLSACLAINLHEGESVQPWHTDDSHIELPRPRPSMGVSTFWAIDDMTEDNGATELLLGSHHWGEEEFAGKLAMTDFSNIEVKSVDVDPGARPETVKATIPSGSLMVVKGGLWHRGGANKTSDPRLIVTPQFCPGWTRPLENMLLTVPDDILVQLSERALELIGYSIHPPFMGYVDGVHPKKSLV